MGLEPFQYEFSKTLADPGGKKSSFGRGHGVLEVCSIFLIIAERGLVGGEVKNVFLGVGLILI